MGRLCRAFRALPEPVEGTRGVATGELRTDRRRVEHSCGLDRANEGTLPRSITSTTGDVGHAVSGYEARQCTATRTRRRPSESGGVGDMESNRSVGESVEDAKLLRRIGAMFDHLDPVPDAVVAAARSAFAWREMDSQLAQLIDEEQLAGSATRAHGEHRLLTFEAPGMTVAIEATEI